MVFLGLKLQENRKKTGRKPKENRKKTGRKPEEKKTTAPPPIVYWILAIVLPCLTV
jgi:hypothetical protein